MSEPRDADTVGRVDLASARLGGRVLRASDDFFAEKENLIQPSSPVWISDKYTDRGKWMDGWESRRRRTSGNDWCIVALAAIGSVEELVVDTAFFTGNFPEAGSVDGWLGDGDPSDAAVWSEVLARSPLVGDAENRFVVANDASYSHLRLNIFPDGGVARLRAYGSVRPDWPSIMARGGSVDLAATLHGGRVVDCSDRHYSAPENMLLPGRSTGMHDGWETRRRRGPGHDWCVVQLGRPGVIHAFEVDTTHFKGNYPDRCSIEVAVAAPDTEPAELAWTQVLAETRLEADRGHRFKLLDEGASATHVRLNIHPDGGVARLRVIGEAQA